MSQAYRRKYTGLNYDGSEYTVEHEWNSKYKEWQQCKASGMKFAGKSRVQQGGEGSIPSTVTNLTEYSEGVDGRALTTDYVRDPDTTTVKWIPKNPVDDNQPTATQSSADESTSMVDSIEPGQTTDKGLWVQIPKSVDQVQNDSRMSFVASDWSEVDEQTSDDQTTTPGHIQPDTTLDCSPRQGVNAGGLRRAVASWLGYPRRR